ncbi:sensor histidine kinase [Paramicrobacterium chengjingii]|uniref:sensor histidine kinase n=1 Tax=Paramicrobacterium chengjingii TaxID=2769067 RepID=UPI00141E1AF9|nr:histidine kinase [Microbacterium chengjingii]
MATITRVASRAVTWARARPGLMHWGGTALFAAACTVLVVAGNVGVVVDRELGRAVFALPVAMAVLGNALRRRAPGVALVLSLMAVGFDLALGGSNALILYVMDGLYSASCYGRRGVRRATYGVAVAGVAMVTVGPMAQGLNAVVLGALQGIAIFGTPIWWGANVRQRNEIAELGDERLALERERGDDLRRIAELQRDEAVRDERSRMASELHDVVASRLSAIALNSAAGLTVPTTGDTDAAWRGIAERQRAVLETVRESSIGALHDMRSLITVLRAGDEPLAAASVDTSLAGLERLVRDAESASEISVSLSLPDSASYDAIGDPVRQAITRICGEIIANAVKHAPGSVLDLLIDIGGVVRIVARNTMPHAGADAAVPSAGIGIRVMRERAEAFGGELESSADDSGCWRVDARIPVQSSTTGATP